MQYATQADWNYLAPAQKREWPDGAKEMLVIRSETDEGQWEPVEIVETWTRALRKVVEDHQFCEWAGVLIDVQTANAVMIVYDQCPDHLKQTMIERPLMRVVNAVWRTLVNAGRA